METLYTSKSDESFIITEVPQVNLLNSLGIFVGAKIKKKRTYKFGGPILIDIFGREVAIGKEIAEQIKVKECV